MRSDYVHLSVLLDASGSMEPFLVTTIDGFNSFLHRQLELDGKLTLSVDAFNQRSESLVEFKEQTQQKRFVLNRNNYFPNGGTALYDSISRLMTRTGTLLAELPESERPAKVLFLIITDGEENCSERVNYDTVKNMIEHQQNVYNWDIVYIGADGESVDQGRALGIKENKVAQYDQHTTGAMFCALSADVSAYRSGLREFSFSQQNLS